MRNKITVLIDSGIWGALTIIHYVSSVDSQITILPKLYHKVMDNTLDKTINFEIVTYQQVMKDFK